MKYWWNEQKYAFGHVRDLIHYNWKVRGGGVAKLFTRSTGINRGKTYRLVGQETYPSETLAVKEANRLARLHPSKSYVAIRAADAISTGLKYKKGTTSLPERNNAILGIYAVYSRDK